MNQSKYALYPENGGKIANLDNLVLKYCFEIPVKFIISYFNRLNYPIDSPLFPHGY